MKLEVFTSLVLLVSGAGASWVADNYPNPQMNPEQCVKNAGVDSLWMCDPDAVLTASDASEILTIVTDVNSRAECACNCTNNPENGYIVGVAIVGEITEQPDNEDQSTILATFGQTVKDSWFPTAACDDKVLILLCRNFSQINILLGSTLSESTPLSTVDMIYERIQTSLQGMQYREALEVSLKELAVSISGGLAVNGTETMTTEAPEPEDNLVWGILGVIAIMTILVFHYWIKY